MKKKLNEWYCFPTTTEYKTVTIPYFLFPHNSITILHFNPNKLGFLLIQKPLLRASWRFFFKKFWYQATYYRFPSVWTLFSSLFKNRPKCPTKEFVPGTKKCQKSRTNTGELTTSGESISGHCTHSTQVKETQHFHRFQKHQEHQFKSYFKNCFFSLSGTSHDFKLLFGVGLWLQLDQKKKEKKIENRDFLITFGSGPA